MPDSTKHDDREANLHHLPWEWEHRPNRGCVVFDCRGKEVCSTYKEKRAEYIVASANARQNTVGVEKVRAVIDAWAEYEKLPGNLTDDEAEAISKVMKAVHALQAKIGEQR